MLELVFLFNPSTILWVSNRLRIWYQLPLRIEYAHAHPFLHVHANLPYLNAEGQYVNERDLARQLQRELSSGSLGTSFAVPGSTWKLHALRAARILAGLTVGIILWQIMAWVMNSGGNALDFPGPFETIKRLWQYLFCNQSMYGHSVYEHILASIRRLIVAFALACALGIPLGSLLGYFNSIYEIGIMPVSLLQMIPGLAWLPVAILLFGLGDDSAIFIIFAVSSMVITIGTASGIRMVPDVLVNAARMSGASGLTVFFQVLIPQASASIINAMRLGMASAWRVLIAAEMIVGTGIGIGYSVQMTRDLLDYVGAFACIAVICLVGLLFDRVLLGGIEQLMRNRIEGGKR